MNLLRGEMKRLVVERTGMLVEFHHSHDDFDHLNCNRSQLELGLSLYWAVQTRYILQTLRVRRRNAHGYLSM